MRQCQDECRSLSGGVPKNLSLHWMKKNKLASLEATLVRNSAHSLTHLLTGVKCRATSVAKNCSCYHQIQQIRSFPTMYTYTWGCFSGRFW